MIDNNYDFPEDDENDHSIGSLGEIELDEDDERILDKIMDNIDIELSEDEKFLLSYYPKKDDN